MFSQQENIIGSQQLHQEIIFPEISKPQLALQDIKTGLSKWHIWLMLAYQDIKLRYRRSLLGPFWITISMAITVYTMGFLYSRLFHIDLATYYPFLVAGMLGWSLISTIILELAEGFTNSDTFLKQIKLPYTLYIHRVIARNFIIFFHNIFVIIPILIIYHDSVKINLSMLFILPGLFFIYLNGFTYGLMLAIIGARYRDTNQMIKSVIQIIFFITPVMWSPAIFTNRTHFLINLNPFYAFLEFIRAPLLGNMPTIQNISIVLIASLLGVLLCSFLFTKYRARIIYWL